MLGCGEAGYQDAGMWGSKAAAVLGWWNMGTWGCRVSGVRGWRSAACWDSPGCREMEIHRDGGAVRVRTLGCRDSCRPVRCCGGTSGASHLRCSPKHAGEAGDGEVGHVVGWLLAQAQLTQQLPHHWRQLEPVACGREKEGGDTTIPMTLDSSGMLDWGRGCPRLPEKPAPMKIGRAHV